MPLKNTSIVRFTSYMVEEWGSTAFDDMGGYPILLITPKIEEKDLDKMISDYFAGLQEDEEPDFNQFLVILEEAGYKTDILAVDYEAEFEWM